MDVTRQKKCRGHIDNTSHFLDVTRQKTKMQRAQRQRHVWDVMNVQGGPRDLSFRTTVSVSKRFVYSVSVFETFRTLRISFRNVSYTPYQFRNVSYTPYQFRNVSKTCLVEDKDQSKCIPSPSLSPRLACIHMADVLSKTKKEEGQRTTDIINDISCD
jgi:hypothetical protein